MLNQYPRQGSASILILLTDGDPTTGDTTLISWRLYSTPQKSDAFKPVDVLEFIITKDTKLQKKRKEIILDDVSFQHFSLVV